MFSTSQTHYFARQHSHTYRLERDVNVRTVRHLVTYWFRSPNLLALRELLYRLHHTGPKVKWSGHKVNLFPALRMLTDALELPRQSSRYPAWLSTGTSSFYTYRESTDQRKTRKWSVPETSTEAELCVSFGLYDRRKFQSHFTFSALHRCSLNEMCPLERTNVPEYSFHHITVQRSLPFEDWRGEKKSPRPNTL